MYEAELTPLRGNNSHSGCWWELTGFSWLCFLSSFPALPKSEDQSQMEESAGACGIICIHRLHLPLPPVSLWFLFFFFKLAYIKLYTAKGFIMTFPYRHIVYRDRIYPIILSYLSSLDPPFLSSSISLIVLWLSWLCLFLVLFWKQLSLKGTLLRVILAQHDMAPGWQQNWEEGVGSGGVGWALASADSQAKKGTFSSHRQFPMKLG
jgi:hypothetical protein